MPTSIVYHKRYGTIKKNKALQEKIKNQSILNIIKTIRRHATFKQKLRINLIWIRGAIEQRFNLFFYGKKNGPDYLEQLKLLWFKKI